jgi:hypothetical protein
VKGVIASVIAWQKYYVQRPDTSGSDIGVKGRDRVREEVD